MPAETDDQSQASMQQWMSSITAAMQQAQREVRPELRVQDPDYKGPVLFKDMQATLKASTQKGRLWNLSRD